MGITPIERLKLAISRALHGAPKGEAGMCGYGPCGVAVAPFDGYRDNGHVFCTADHAVMDQEEAF